MEAAKGLGVRDDEGRFDPLCDQRQSLRRTPQLGHTGAHDPIHFRCHRLEPDTGGDGTTVRLGSCQDGDVAGRAESLSESGDRVDVASGAEGQDKNPHC